MIRAVLAAGAVALGCRHGSGADPGRQQRAAIVQRGELVERVLLTGVVHPTEATDIAVPATDEPSLAIRWMIADGTAVKAGDRVVVLDDAPFTSRLIEGRHQLLRAETQFRLSSRATAIAIADRTAAVRQAEIAVEKARFQAELPADLVTARAAHDSQLRLATATAELTKARRELTMTTAVLALEDRVRRLELDKTRHTITAAEQAITALSLVAPRDGIVVVAEQPPDGRKLAVGESAEAGQVVLSQPDLDKPMEVRAELSDADDGRVALDMTGTCTLDAYPAAPIVCTVTELAPIARPPDGHDPTRRTFGVTLALAHGDPARLRPGMSVKIELPGPPHRGLVIPRSALTSRSPARVRLATGPLRDVVVGGCDAQRCAVTSGLVEGELVALGGAS